MIRGPRKLNKESKAKQAWRKFTYSLATPDNCSSLVDDKGIYQYKWLELVEKGALTFNQLLSTKRINESQLIGVDEVANNIYRCRKLFPKAQFHANGWRSFCRTYPDNDIGVINFDSWNAAHGKDFNASLSATMNLAVRCKRNIGECLVIINVDGRRTRSSINKMSSRETLKGKIEESLKNSQYTDLSQLVIDVDSMYEYKNYRQSTEMLTCGILL